MNGSLYDLTYLWGEKPACILNVNTQLGSDSCRNLASALTTFADAADRHETVQSPMQRWRDFKRSVPDSGSSRTRHQTT